MSAIGWAPIEVALVGWVKQGAGVDDDHVQFAYEADGIPATGPWVELNLKEVSTVGRDWRTVEANPDSTGSDGAELLIKSQGMREAILVVQCFGVEGSGNDALQRMADLVSYLPLNYDAIDDAGAGIGEVTKVELISGKRGSVLEPRARFEVRLHVASEVIATGTYIEFVQLKMKPKNALEVTLETDLWIPTTPP